MVIRIAAIFFAVLVLFPAAVLAAETTTQPSPGRQSVQMVWTSAGTHILSGEKEPATFLKDRWLMQHDNTWLELLRSDFEKDISKGDRLNLFRIPAELTKPPQKIASADRGGDIWLPLEETSKTEELPDPEQTDSWYIAWRLHPTFIHPPYLSYLSEEAGFAGGAHGWSSLDPLTIDLRTLEPLAFKDLFVSGKWRQIKRAVIDHIMTATWDRSVRDLSEAIRDAEESFLTDGRLEVRDRLEKVGEQPFLLTYGPQGGVAHIIYGEYEIHCYALGGVRLSIDLSQLPSAAKDALVPEIANARFAPPSALKLKYPDLETSPLGVRADPKNEYDCALQTQDWFIGSAKVTGTIPTALLKPTTRPHPDPGEQKN